MRKHVWPWVMGVCVCMLACMHAWVWVWVCVHAHDACASMCVCSAPYAISSEHGDTPDPATSVACRTWCVVLSTQFWCLWWWSEKWQLEWIQNIMSCIRPTQPQSSKWQAWKNKTHTVIKQRTNEGAQCLWSKWKKQEKSNNNKSKKLIVEVWYLDLKDIKQSQFDGGKMKYLEIQI